MDVGEGVDEFVGDASEVGGVAEVAGGCVDAEADGAILVVGEVDRFDADGVGCVGGQVERLFVEGVQEVVFKKDAGVNA